MKKFTYSINYSRAIANLSTFCLRNFFSVDCSIFSHHSKIVPKNVTVRKKIRQTTLNYRFVIFDEMLIIDGTFVINYHNDCTNWHQRGVKFLELPTGIIIYAAYIIFCGQIAKYKIWVEKWSKHVALKIRNILESKFLAYNRKLWKVLVKIKFSIFSPYSSVTFLTSDFWPPIFDLLFWPIIFGLWSFVFDLKKLYNSGQRPRQKPWENLG